jgi:hypothetical protein
MIKTFLPIAYLILIVTELGGCAGSVGRIGVTTNESSLAAEKNEREGSPNDWALWGRAPCPARH